MNKLNSWEKLLTLWEEILNFEPAKIILDDIKEANLQHLLKDLIEYAIRYARIRTDRYLLSNGRRTAMNLNRSSAHNVFIDCCNILSRNMLNIGEDNS